MLSLSMRARQLPRIGAATKVENMGTASNSATPLDPGVATIS